MDAVRPCSIMRRYLTAHDRSASSCQVFRALCWASSWKVWIEKRLTAYVAFLKHPQLWVTPATPTAVWVAPSASPEDLSSRQKREKREDSKEAALPTEESRSMPVFTGSSPAVPTESELLETKWPIDAAKDISEGLSVQEQHLSVLQELLRGMQ
mmetsp:Transcript_43414/g.68761  ORF Transcript_43414/g.68761 Transcript_43414/m.68761 type:complete len:154 (-) Transcript_43414:47-508(-)